jgi:type IV secretory pathway VirB10-like protein
MPVGTTGRTITASTTPKTPPRTALPPARSLAELTRDEDASGASPMTTAEAAAAAARTTPVTDTPPPTAIAARVVPPTPADEVNRQKEIVLAVLREYSRAYERLDVRATKAVYPSVDDRKLQRAFQELEGQQVRFASCGVSISSSGAGANARCRGDATFRPKVGSRIVRLTDREWTFSLSRGGSGWQILDARMQ